MARAHQFAAEVISSRGHTIDKSRIVQAHQKVIWDYLAARRADNSEWTMNKIIEDIIDLLGIDRRGIPSPVGIYKLNDHIQNIRTDVLNN